MQMYAEDIWVYIFWFYITGSVTKMLLKYTLEIQRP